MTELVIICGLRRCLLANPSLENLPSAFSPEFECSALVGISIKRDNVLRIRRRILSDRKYRQRGYQDSREEPRQKSAGAPPKKDNTFGPRPLQMAASRQVSRCSQCGTLLTGADPSGKCPKCGFELHSCKQCTYFDPSSRFECMQPVKERVARKDARNDCTFYSIRVTMEKETSSHGSAAPNAARRAFDDLFKD
jgi:hypothetical protein